MEDITGEIDEKSEMLRIRELSDRIAACLPQKIEAAALTLNSKIPFKALSLREVLICRISELASVSIQLYEDRKLVSAFIITRAIVETAAFTYWLHHQLSSFFSHKNPAQLDQFLMRVLVGSRDKTTPVESCNVLTAIDKLDKEYQWFRKGYDRLCEFTHPNWGGLLGTYGRINHDKYELELGVPAREPPITFGLVPLSAASLLFEHYYNELAGLIEKRNAHFEQYTNESA